MRQVSEARLLDEASHALSDRFGILERDGLPQEEGSTPWKEVEPPETPRLTVPGVAQPPADLFWRQGVTATTLPDPQTQADSEAFLDLVVEIGVARADRGADVRHLLSLTARYPKAPPAGP